MTRIVRKTVHLAKFSPIISRFQESTNYRLDSKSVMYSKEMFLKSEKISKKIKKMQLLVAFLSCIFGLFILVLSGTTLCNFGPI